VSPENTQALDRARALLVNRTRIVDPDRVADESVTVFVGDTRVRLVDETMGLVLTLDARAAEDVGRALLAGAARLRVEARETTQRQARDDDAYEKKKAVAS